MAVMPRALQNDFVNALRFFKFLTICFICFFRDQPEEARYLNLSFNDNVIIFYFLITDNCF